MSSSYPFLALARHHEVDYRAVLTYADCVDDGDLESGRWRRLARLNTKILPLRVRKDVRAVCAMPKRERCFPLPPWCVFCKRHHEGGDTCMGHHP